MPDGGFKGMTPDPDSAPRGRRAWLAGVDSLGQAVECERCHGPVFEGDWPWCRGSVSDHER